MKASIVNADELNSLAYQKNGTQDPTRTIGVVLIFTQL